MMITKDKRRGLTVRLRTLRRGAGLLSTIAFSAALAMLSTGGHSTPVKATAKPVAASMAVDKPFPATNFTLKDTNGVKHSLSSYRGRTVALYFFCGCDWCHAVAGKWSVMQRAGALPKHGGGKDPLTLIVFSGDASAARQFATETSLDMSSTIMLTDLDMNVTLNPGYNAEPCPRVFVVNPAGNVVYTNDHKDDQARKAPAAVIVNRALAAVLKSAAG